MNTLDMRKLLQQSLYLHTRDRAATNTGHICKTGTREVTSGYASNGRCAHATDQSTLKDGDRIIGFCVIQHNDRTGALEAKADWVVLAAAYPFQACDWL